MANEKNYKDTNSLEVNSSENDALNTESTEVSPTLDIDVTKHAPNEQMSKHHLTPNENSKSKRGSARKSPKMNSKPTSNTSHKGSKRSSPKGSPKSSPKVARKNPTQQTPNGKESNLNLGSDHEPSGESGGEKSTSSLSSVPPGTSIILSHLYGDELPEDTIPLFITGEILHFYFFTKKKTTFIYYLSIDAFFFSLSLFLFYGGRS